jgi:F-type H+-transporting ATPase subunit delta
MANQTVARRYAVAVFGLAADAHAVAEVGRDLHVIGDALLHDEETKAFFLSPVVDRKQKEAALAATFGNTVHEIALHTVLLLVRKRREMLLRELVEQYDALELQARGAEPLTITAATQLDPAGLRTLVGRLERLYGKRFEVTQKTDPHIIGGARITMGDRRIDGSVEGRLEELTRTLFAQHDTTIAVKAERLHDQR